MKLSKLEQESIILYNEEESTASIYTHDPKLKRKLKRLAEQVISENLGQMVVTPRDIDSIVEDMSGIIATGINMALFGKSFEDVRMLIA